MEKISTLIKPLALKKKTRNTERGDLLQFFMERINISRQGTKYAGLTIPRIAKMVEGLEIKDLYYIRSEFSDRERRDGLNAACKWFYFSLRPSKTET